MRGTSAAKSELWQRTPVTGAMFNVVRAQPAVTALTPAAPRDIDARLLIARVGALRANSLAPGTTRASELQAAQPSCLSLRRGKPRSRKRTHQSCQSIDAPGPRAAGGGRVSDVTPYVRMRPSAQVDAKPNIWPSMPVPANVLRSHTDTIEGLHAKATWSTSASAALPGAKLDDLVGDVVRYLATLTIDLRRLNYATRLEGFHESLSSDAGVAGIFVVVANADLCGWLWRH